MISILSVDNIHSKKLQPGLIVLVLSDTPIDMACVELCLYLCLAIIFSAGDWQ